MLLDTFEFDTRLHYLSRITLLRSLRLIVHFFFYPALLGTDFLMCHGFVSPVWLSYVCFVLGKSIWSLRRWKQTGSPSLRSTKKRRTASCRRSANCLKSTHQSPEPFLTRRSERKSRWDAWFQVNSHAVCLENVGKHLVLSKGIAT